MFAMASSFIVELGEEGKDIASTSTERQTIGYVELVNEVSSEVVAEHVATSGSDVINVDSSSNRKVIISLHKKTPFFSKLWQSMERREHRRLTVVDSREFIEKCYVPEGGRQWVSPVGKLNYTIPMVYLNTRQRNPLRRFIKGFYENHIPVAIQRIELAEQSCYPLTMSRTEINRECEVLSKLEIHENFIRYFSREEDALGQFTYIATELCTCSVADLYEPRKPRANSTKVEVAILPERKRKTILKSLTPKTILFQATRGLEYLHLKGYLHRNVKPSSFLIQEIVSPLIDISQYVIKITDFRLTRNCLDGGELSGTVASDGWEAPESLLAQQDLNQSLDVFLLGCFFHYVLVASATENRSSNLCSLLHPFGNDRERISKETDAVYESNWLPTTAIDIDAVELIKSMLKHKESMRPSLTQVLKHSFFNKSDLKEYYDLYSSGKPGLCVIFNQNKFAGTNEQRFGTEKDCERLKETFTGLGYEVTVFDDNTSDKLRQAIKSLAKDAKLLSGCNSLVVCLMSHGVDGHILCSDNKVVNINELKSEFCLQKCPDLYGKPKIFIVQACRENCDSDVKMTFSEMLAETFRGLFWPSRKNSERQVGIHEKKERPRLPIGEAAPSLDVKGPPLLDFLTISATLPGSLAYRNPEKGSYFIQALCGALEDEYFDETKAVKQDLETVLRGKKGAQNRINECAKFRENWQTMPWEACLTKHIRFEDRRSNNNQQRSRLTIEPDSWSSPKLFGLPATWLVRWVVVSIVPLLAAYLYCNVFSIQ